MIDQITQKVDNFILFSSLSGYNSMCLTDKRNLKIILLFFILLGSLSLNLWNQHFSTGYHADEYKKIHFIQTSTQNFYHPILLLQTARAANYFFELTDGNHIALLGRSISALCGSAIVLIWYLIARRSLSTKYSLLLALIIAISPIIVVHSHYFKEDMIFSCFLSLSLLFFLSFFVDNKRSISRILLLGLSTGLALSSKYVAAFLPLAYFIIPLICKTENKRKLYKDLLKVTGISLIVFCFINYPLFFDFQKFWQGFQFEMSHVTTGHERILGTGKLAVTAITPFEFWFGFHLLYSIIPGITLPITLISLGFLLVLLFSWKKITIENRILSFIAILFYFIAECSPTKPPPDFMRYMMPIAPILLFFALQGARFAVNNSNKWARAPVITLFIVCAAYSLWDTSQIVYHLNRDTRDLAKEWIDKSGKNAKGESYTLLEKKVPFIAFLDIDQEKSQGIQYLVANNFVYDQMSFAHKLRKCPKLMEEGYQSYQKLFELPYVEIKPAYKSFAFSNPTIRIIDICSPKNEQLTNLTSSCIHID